MKNRMIYLFTILFFLLLAACTGSATEPLTSAAEPAAVENEVTENDNTMSEHNDEEMLAADDEMAATQSSETVDDTVEESGVENIPDTSSADAAAERPAWQQISLTNAQTGEPFTLADFAGKTVYVEPMATWCTNCRRQLTNVTFASSEFNAEEVVFVALSVEVGLQDSQLASYAESQGFPFVFAVINETMLRELANEFGQSVANPPATPRFIIRADGTTTDLFTGIESAEEIAAFIQAEIQ